MITTTVLCGQDTIVVPTFTWESESRDSVFRFPDDPGQTYHKILMKYGMRCHDLAVGNGDVGCREWDYSCNTIIYDSTRTDSVLVDDGMGNLVYETSSPVRYEIMSFVTPYGNGLDLGPEGKTWTFDLTDYAPILKGKKRMALIGGGQNQEEMQITFYFITGTPEREVIDIRPIWPLQFQVTGDPINENLRFEPRNVKIPDNTEHVGIKSVITGHGQTGEFTPFMHRLTINNDRREAYRVWKECSNIPVYPQGGTWLLDRAGWCPGDPSQVNFFELTAEEISAGEFTIDYSVRDIVQAPDLRYIVNHQMIFYGPYNFDNDLSVHDIIRPSERVEHARFNPVCFKPEIVIRNGGSNDVTAARIEYGIRGQQKLVYDWNGELATGDTDTIELEYPEEEFTRLAAESHFEVSILDDDDYSDNNHMTVTFQPVPHYQGERVLLLLTTNKAPKDNRLELRNSSGELLLEYDELESSRSYFEEVTLDAGCYEILLTDNRDDGLYYWAYETNGPNIGRGGLEIFVDDISVHEFEPEFGRFVQFDFSVATATAVEQAGIELLSVYPNPAEDQIYIESTNTRSNTEIRIYTVDGQLLQRSEHTSNRTIMQTDHLKPGIYILELLSQGQTSRTKIVKQ
ncbi:MAG: T9SS type A sorting domain-containing protein [Saprospiraceae bacterium]|nr:T9SS type A sorting domain-containing protein [Saprospiraceae bacterium]